MDGERPQPNGSLEFNERERLYDRISHERFMAILSGEQTTPHSITISSNNYGEFLFVTLS